MTRDYPQQEATTVNGHKAIENIDTLLAAIGVSRHAACIRAGINYSTVHRWNNGGECKPENLGKLRAAALAIAHDSGIKLTKLMQRELDAGRKLLDAAKPSCHERLDAIEARLKLVEQRA